MNYRWVGAILIVISCAGIGIYTAKEQARTEKQLLELIHIFDYMESEIKYRLLPLPQLCRLVGAGGKSTIEKVFLLIAEELEEQVSPDVEHCVRAAITRMKKLPEPVEKIMECMGMTFGVFSLDGQLKALACVRSETTRYLDKLQNNKDIRLRSYRTLGVCAGVAIVILLV